MLPRLKRIFPNDWKKQIFFETPSKVFFEIEVTLTSGQSLYFRKSVLPWGALLATQFAADIGLSRPKLG